MSIIKVENLGKKYIIGHDRNVGGAFRSRSLRDTLTHTARSLYQRLRHPLSPNSVTTEIEELWALRNLEFDIEPGDLVTFPKGLKCVWDVKEAIRKRYTFK